MNFQCPFCQAIVSVENSDCGINVQCGQCGEITTSPTSRISSRVVIGNDFIILEEIGRGGMGVVFLAHQISLDRPTAVKILSPRYANNSEFIAGFIKEARAAAKLNHPHIVQAYAVGEEDGIYYFAMEFIDGETMKNVLKRETFVPPDRALVIIQQIAEALDYAWKEQQLIHRDIKPDNIMITKNGRAKLADLGLAKFAEEIDDADKDEVMGTPQYISPEHLTGMPMDVRSDIYSLGATFFHIITGRFPFTGKDALEIARKHIETPLESPRKVNPATPESIAQIIMKMMEKAPENRYQSAEELAEDIRLVRRGKSPTIAITRGGVGTNKKSGARAAPSLHGKTLMLTASKTPSHAEMKSPMSSSSGTFGTRGLQKPQYSVSQTTTTIRKMKEKKAKKQVYMTVAVVVLSLLAATAFMIWKFSPPKKKPIPTVMTKPKIPQPGGDVRPPGSKPASNLSDLEQGAMRILTFFKTKYSEKAQVLQLCDDFFSVPREPSNDSEKDLLEQVNMIFIPLDEDRIALARQEAKKDYLLRVEDWKKEDEKRRQAEEAKKEKVDRIATAEKVKKDAENRNQKRVDEYRIEIARKKESNVFRAIIECSKFNFSAAGKLFEDAWMEKDKITDDRAPDAKKYSDWAKKMDDAIKNASEFYNKLNNNNILARGPKIEMQKKGDSKKPLYGTIESIKDGIITMKTADGMVTQRLDEQIPRIFKLIVKKVADKCSMQENELDFFMLTADFEAATELAKGNKETEEFISEIAYFYIKQRLITNKDASKELKAKYGKMPEFEKALNDSTGGK